ncbi:MAG: hypothetical protein F6K19_40270 [Cyanothece sp. SIO1E1]|nr:hypothetical protein [Cyanothece sp. SIO1E1]
MTQVILDNILNQLEQLEPEELNQLSWAIQKYLADKAETTQRIKFYQALLASGLVKQLKIDHSKQTERQLIQVQGKPVSETIIEERR